ncbi:hypothetical protein CH330_02755 [candidate division WOR-3 bacterium JGI_Cruoil_03_51_56]|uniref:peptidylprolyl isomerase n=1 Tax=candidate division WOR-3 bacterium JGI_Cruoil_03_51_56 TaxID=1973747 RepID=A0A235BY27_UNCW3|nr:MAG: hypothetical protein CH330_02755 [candidate division WOR-3 bacterium JGI_Cruoil_03_51_56]
MIHIAFRLLYRYSVVALAGLLIMECSQKQPVVARVNNKAITSQQLAASLPWRIDSTIGEDKTKHRVLENIVTKELFVQEAERQGLEQEITYRLELEKKGLVTQELYNTVVARGNRLNELDLEVAYKLLKNEIHTKLIEVPSESLARRIASELNADVPFETLAVRYSVHPSAPSGGDLGYRPELAIPEPVRSVVLALAPGGRTNPVRVGNNYQIIMLVDRRPADPPPPPFQEIKQKLTSSLKQKQRRDLANKYLADLRTRLVYDPKGLDILCKPVDSITEEEKEECVAIRDNTKYVKVKRLLHVARRFPASLDTAMRKYTIRREIEEDLLYDDALHRGLDKLPRVQKKLAQKHSDLLYEALYKKEITDKVTVSDKAVRNYYEQNRSKYVNSKFEAVSSMIRHRLLAERRDKRLKEYTAGLRSKANITIDEVALRSVARARKNSKEHK